MREFMVNVHLRHMRRSKYFSNNGDYEPRTAIKPKALKNLQNRILNSNSMETSYKTCLRKQLFSLNTFSVDGDLKILYAHDSFISYFDFFLQLIR